MKKTIKTILLTILICCSSTLLHAQNGDRDGDGVLDKDDVCPDVAGSKENKGCPVEIQDKATAAKSFGFVYKTNEKDSVLVQLVFEKSPAQLAGIQATDLIQSFNDKTILEKSKKEVQEIIKNLPNDNIKIGLKRNGLLKEIILSKVEKNTFTNVCLTGNCINGKGIFQDADGNKYDGNFKDAIREGNGKMYYANGNFYDGNWVNNKRNGRGKLTFTGGAEFKGDWRNDAYQGNGEYKWANGEYYNGGWVKGIKSGYGKQKLLNGDYYEGNFFNGKMEGKGTYKFASGNEYVGEFTNNQYEGYGEFKKADGTEQKGMWVANVFQVASVPKKNIVTDSGDVSNVYSKEGMNEELKKYDPETNKKVDASKKSSEELQKSKPFDFTLEEFNAAKNQVTPEFRKVAEELKKNSEDIRKKSAGAIAILYLKENKFEEATVAINEGIQKYPDYADNYYIRGLAKKGLKNYYSAVEDFTKAIELNSKKGLYFAEKGVCNFALSFKTIAITDFDEAIKLEPNNVEYYLKRAFFKSKTGDHIGAISDYDQALLKGATSKEIYLDRGIEKSMINKTAGCNDLKVAKNAQVNGAEKAFEICGCK